jgi:succinate dehydrogenase flavin-adding protein (antitoxin of CptAB toxin-antitoxin module)
MKELDVLLTRFLDRDYASASSAERAAFVALLEWQDPDLARYLLAGERHTEPATAAVIERLRKA